MKEKIKALFRLNRSYKINLILASFTLFFVIWFSSGTLSPYSLHYPEVLIKKQYTTVIQDSSKDETPVRGSQEAFQCQYIANIDHWHFLATFLMLDGQPKGNWEASVVLRRILYPVLAYPFMKLMGFETGGFVTTFFIYLISFLLFVSFVRREVGQSAAIFAAWAVVTFPGIAYFGGLPYSYVFIIPGCLIITMLLWELIKATEIKPIFILSFGIGIIFLGYDFLPIFGFAAVFILVRNKLFLGATVSLITMLIPTIIFNVILKYYYEVQLTNSNTEMYQIIALSYGGVFHDLLIRAFSASSDSPTAAFLNENASFPDMAKWFDLINYFPLNLLFNYLFSTFMYLPIAFGLINIPRLFGKRLKLNSLEAGVLLAGFLVFAFNNLAPPYRSWQMRGYGYARIYEPIFVVMILYICRKVQLLSDIPLKKQKIVWGLISILIIGNFITCFSTIIPNNLGLAIDANFYTLDLPTYHLVSAFKERIRKYGKYPIGFCSPPPNANP